MNISDKLKSGTFSIKYARCASIHTSNILDANDVVKELLA